MSIFIMTVGLPASGKDTLYHDVYEDNFTMVSSDDIREELYGDVNDQTHNVEVFDTMYKRTVALLSGGKNVYYNATNLSQKRRIHLLNSLKARVDFHSICIVFTLPFNECLIRNSMRKRVVPSHAMGRMVRNFNPPSYCEGWDNILFYRDGEATDINRIRLAAEQVPHDNPHHTLTIGQHMSRATTLYISDCLDKGEKIDRIISDTLNYHDIGKPFCKTFTNMKGEPTEIAHYYFHENVGAYIFLSSITLSHLDNDDGSLLVANLIAHHMDKFKGDKYMAKIQKLYGTSFTKALETINHYDTAAH